LRRCDHQRKPLFSKWWFVQDLSLILLFVWHSKYFTGPDKGWLGALLYQKLIPRASSLSNFHCEIFENVQFQWWNLWENVPRKLENARFHICMNIKWWKDVYLNVVDFKLQEIKTLQCFCAFFFAFSQPTSKWPTYPSLIDVRNLYQVVAMS
jgi:hypothetical protein